MNSLPRRFGEPFERIGPWGWLALYSTGFILLFFLLAHIWLVHYVSDQPITWKNVLLSLRSPFVRTVSLGLLFFSLIHGMMGLRRVILDLELLKKKGSLYLDWGLVLAAILLLTWGLIIFYRLSSA